MSYTCDDCEQLFWHLTDAHKRSHGGWDCSNCYGELTKDEPIKYKVDNTIDPTNSSKMCNIIAPYEKMVECFGEPISYPGDTISHEWRIIFDDGLKMFVYWMNNELNPDVKNNTYWTVGGFRDPLADHYMEFAKYENRMEHYVKGKEWHAYP